VHQQILGSTLIFWDNLARLCGAFPHFWRGEIVLLSAAGIGTVEIMRQTGKSKTCVWRWQERFPAAAPASVRCSGPRFFFYIATPVSSPASSPAHVARSHFHVRRTGC
jgi:hypothetical protein